jgi:hypothetical protein
MAAASPTKSASCLGNDESALVIPARCCLRGATQSKCCIGT